MRSAPGTSSAAQSTFSLDLAHSWHEPPSVGGHRVLQITTGGLYLAGGTIVLLAAILLAGDQVDRGPIAAVACLALTVGAVIIAWGDRFSRLTYHLAVSLGTVLIASVVILAGGGAASVAMATIFLFVIIDAIFLFSLREAMVQIVFCACACAVSLAVVGDSVRHVTGNLVLIEGTFLVVGTVVGWLARVANQAEVDPLTALLNRRGFDRRLDDDLARFRRDGGPLALVVLDVDYFKAINDDGGHARGDRLLTACARAWERVLPEAAALARYGGDEFALLLPGWSLGRAADLADDLRALAPYGITVSSGVASALARDSGSMLVSRADVALYEAKSTGRDRTVVHGDPERSSSELENAIADGQLVLHLQPIVQLSSDEVVAYEGLVRWLHPTKGLIPPDRFVPEAERTGAIHSLGAWVLEETARLVTSAPRPRARIGVNISVNELRSDSYVDRVTAVLERWALPGDRLIAEITESAFDDGDPRILENITGLRKLGIHVAIDDFGAGYSSLHRLESLPIDLIKVDGSLIQAIRPDSYDAPILEAIVSIGRSLGVQLVAEHVETAHQAAVLRRLGYDLVQGYLFGRPLPH
ncbi:bifunctional diguanylate cyclase/phosphodiesterase [Nocardioides sp.]|uniref:putative bifunctional diguanylate cyclase/phosphodiesterase n=1 Tax=Nocardioides sp. TaxID=35761 RepID=UPI002637B260|nr:bifunctional diguanylate cyclase/phosphodiesterase [Nocardioides sp.]